MKRLFSTTANVTSRIGAVFVAALTIASVSPTASAQSGDPVPKNIDGMLRRLIEQQSQSKIAAATAGDQTKAHVAAAVQRHAMLDNTGRVLVNIHLDGSASLDEVRGQVLAAGATEMASTNDYRSGVVAAYVPITRLAEVAGKPGVLSVTLSARPVVNVGRATSGGVPVIHSDELNKRGIKGDGITVGALSDSYNAATFDLSGNPLHIHARQDVRTNDLPGKGNPFNPHPVLVLDEYQPAGPDDTSATDEGRAMLQIVHDVAPKAKLAFASAFNGEVAFANNIRKLRKIANCDVIVDDVFYFDEPFFSDGIVAQAVDDVVFSDSLPGKKCAYFSSAGNQQGGGYLSTFDRVSNNTARGGLSTQNLKLGQVPNELTSRGFHDFNPKGGERDISQTFNIPAGTPDSPRFVLFLFQWDDPFNLRNGVTTDYNMLVFDADGNYISPFSGIDDNTATQQPFEIAIFVNDGPATTFQIAITRGANSSSQPEAKRLRYLSVNQFFQGYGAAEYYQEDAPTTFGHNSARGAIGTAAYVYDSNPSNPPAPPYTPEIEDFTSSGPVTIALGSNGHRLAEPIIRRKPDIAAPDGGNTTFFGFDFEGDGLPNFFGTSAAAPHGAGVAALLLQQAGGPESLTPTKIKKALQASAGPHDLDSFFIQAIAGPFENATVVTGFGNSSTASSQDPNFFTIDFHGMEGDSLRSVTIDVADAGLKFDTTKATGFPFTFGELDGTTREEISTNAPRKTTSFTRFTITFDRNSFNPEDSVSFGVDRDIFGDGGGNTADLLQGARVIATTWSDEGKQSNEATFQNTFGFGYAIADGFGLIDAVKAANIFQ